MGEIPWPQRQSGMPRRLLSVSGAGELLGVPLVQQPQVAALQPHVDPPGVLIALFPIRGLLHLQLKQLH